MKNPPNKDPFRDWVSAEEKKPPIFDLVCILFDNEKTQPGWWTGHVWDSGKDFIGKNVVAWKMVMVHGVQSHGLGR